MANKQKPKSRAQLIAENRRLAQQVHVLQSQVERLSNQIDVIDVRYRALKAAVSCSEFLPDYPSLREVCKEFQGWLIHGFDYVLPTESKSEEE